MNSKFGGDLSSYTYPINYFIDYVFTKYYNFISGDLMNYWRDQIHDFREAIWRDVCFDSEGNQNIDINLKDFRVMLFVDCMSHRSTTPGAGPINNDGDRRMNRFIFKSTCILHKVWKNAR